LWQQKLDNCDYIKLNSFFPAKETPNKNANYGMGENYCRFVG